MSRESPGRTRQPESLVKLAAAISRERGAPLPAVTKELLHAEILYALMSSGLAASVAFQGGTALRLVYQGNRYSEDLDFAAGDAFDPGSAEFRRFVDLVQGQIGEAYALETQTDIKRDSVDGDGTRVVRCVTRIRIPQLNPALPQKQVINIEFAGVPAHDVETRPVVSPYPQAAAAFRSILLRVESPGEITTDKVKALASRPYLKARDIWDLEFLRNRGHRPIPGLLERKIADYGLTVEAFRQRGAVCLERLAAKEAVDAFRSEMSRFLDRAVADLIDGPTARGMLDRAALDLQAGLQSLSRLPAGPLSEGPAPVAG